MIHDLGYYLMIFENINGEIGHTVNFEINSVEGER